MKNQKMRYNHQFCRGVQLNAPTILLLWGIILTFHSFTSAQDYSLYFPPMAYVQTSDAPSLNPDYLTCELWVKPGLESTPMQIVLSKGIPLGEQFTIALEQGQPEFWLHLSNGNLYEFLNVHPLQPLIWHHLALCYDGQDIDIYINGIPSTIVTTPSTISLGANPLFLSSGIYPSYGGNLDNVRIASEALYEGEIDPFTPTMGDILPFDLEIPRWYYGFGAFDHQEAGDSTSLYDIIDGEAVIYLRFNFQYAIQQYYYGEIASVDEDLRFWITDQGDSVNATGLYYHPMIATGEYLQIPNIGDEARLDTSLLFDYVLDMRYEQFYLSFTTSKENDSVASQGFLTDFAQNAFRAMKYLVRLPIDSSIVLSYSFAQGSGNIALDSSFYQNNGTINGAEWSEGCDFTHPFYIESAEASDGSNPLPGIDEDDKVTLHFNILISTPPPISADNIDSLLTLSAGHSWLSGDGNLGDIQWVDDDTAQYLIITLSTSSGAPTIAIEDTIYPQGIFNAHGKEIQSYSLISGDFGQLQVGNDGLTPRELQVSLPYPNPFNNRVKFQIRTGMGEDVELKIWNIRGETVFHRTLLLETSNFDYIWDTEDSPSGVYFARFSQKNHIIDHKLILVK